MGGGAGFSIVMALMGFVMFGRLIYTWQKRRRAERRRLEVRARARQREEEQERG